MRRTLVDDLGSRLRKAGYVRKWLILGIVIGAVAGLGAIAFTEALQLATRFFLVGLGGYRPPSPLGESAAIGSAQFTRPWAIPLVVGLGGLISGVLMFGLAPEAEGHGTVAAIEAVHHDPKPGRPRSTSTLESFFRRYLREREALTGGTGTTQRTIATDLERLGG
jgi:CIC family chloride channel protein